MVKKISEISEFRGQINAYYKNLGEQMREQMNFTYNRLNKIEANLNAIFKEIQNIKETTNHDREEFRDVIHTLVESLKELVEGSMELPTAIPIETTKLIENPFQVES
jgi:archaellum component FlaC